MREVRNMDINDKILALGLMNKDNIFTIEQVAEYYEVSTKAINTLIQRNYDELTEDGVITLPREKYLDVANNILGLSIRKEDVSHTTILSKRAFLRIGLFINSCNVASKTRNYLLNLEETATHEQKKDCVKDEVEAILRKRMCTAIYNYVPNSKNKIFAYPNYTNMIYKILFGKTAKELKQEKNISTNELLRDSFNKDELKLIDEFETIVTALLSLGFNYDYIQTQLKKKYAENQIIK